MGRECRHEAKWFIGLCSLSCKWGEEPMRSSPLRLCSLSCAQGRVGEG